jgi:hypothetical protein
LALGEPFSRSEVLFFPVFNDSTPEGGFPKEANILRVEKWKDGGVSDGEERCRNLQLCVAIDEPSAEYPYEHALVFRFPLPLYSKFFKV